MFANRICKHKKVELRSRANLKREDALSFLKEILSESPFMTPEAVSLNRLQNPDSYTVHIKERSSYQIIEDIARKRNLLVKEENNVMVIYTPTL